MRTVMVNVPDKIAGAGIFKNLSQTMSLNLNAFGYVRVQVSPKGRHSQHDGAIAVYRVMLQEVNKPGEPDIT